MHPARLNFGVIITKVYHQSPEKGLMSQRSSFYVISLAKMRDVCRLQLPLAMWLLWKSFDLDCSILQIVA